jgi:expansin (peptidoglycan-binding protein)
MLLRVLIIHIVFVGYIISTIQAQNNCIEQQLFKGDGTYYGATGAGNCSFDQGTNNLMVGAMNREQYNGSNACGMCATVKGPKGTVEILITDQCPECKWGDIDLSEQAFEKIADKIAGRVPIEWKYTKCPTNSSIAYKYKEGSSQWWIGIQIRNHRYGVKKLEYKNAQGVFTEIPRKDYNYFVADGGIDSDKSKTGPYHFRLTDIHGQVIEDINVPFNQNQVINGKVQFPECKPTGRPDLIDAELLIVYPNPFNQNINISTGNIIGKTYKILNMQSVLLFEGNSEEINQELIHLPAGIYLLQSDKGQSVKIIKL